MDELDYETHLEHYKNLFGYNPKNPNAETLADAERQAKTHHYLSVFNPIRDLFLKSGPLAEKLTNKNARYFMLHGAGRRLGMIFYAYQTITSIAHPEREQPLSHEQQKKLTREINLLYVNLRGVLDNYAWCFMYERAPELEAKLHRNEIGLFSKKFRAECSAFAEIAKEISIHDEWEKDLKERRDPAAHRIPLYIPNSALTPDEVTRYNNLNAQFHESLNALDFDNSDQAFEQMNQVGTFLPYFLHHPDEPYTPIYPTVPTDLAHLIRLHSALEISLLPK